METKTKPQEEGFVMDISGYKLKCACSTYPTGTPVDKIMDDTAVPSEKIYTSDGFMVNIQQWCECDGGSSMEDAVYFVQNFYNADGIKVGRNHGWACKKCRRVCQTG